MTVTTPQPTDRTTTDAVYGEVVRTERLTPHLIRVVLGGAGLDGFEPTGWTDQYVNALFVPDSAPYDVPFDVDEARSLPVEHRPRGRRETVRSWDPRARELTIDFVVHGDVGFAGRWADRARPGDRLQVTGPSGGYRPDPDADWHLMVGDESALPAISASLEVVPAGRPVVVVAVVDDARHELPLTSPGELELTYVHRASGVGNPDLLLQAVESLTFRPGRVHPFVHGEAAEVRSIRRHLLADRGVPKDGSSISPYWRRGCTDEQWRQIKAEWLAAAENDA